MTADPGCWDFIESVMMKERAVDSLCEVAEYISCHLRGGTRIDSCSSSRQLRRSEVGRAALVTEGTAGEYFVSATELLG